MWRLHYRSMIRGAVICLILGGIVLFSQWAESKHRFEFLAGLSPTNVLSGAEIYERTAGFEELNQTAAAELSGGGFVQFTDERLTDQRTVGYQSRKYGVELYLVGKGEMPGRVEIWVRELEERSNWWSQLAETAKAIVGCKDRRCCPPSLMCIANLKQMDGAKLTWAYEERKGTNDIPRDTEIFGTNSYIRSKPTCPAGGYYTLGRVGEIPRCSIPWHRM